MTAKKPSELRIKRGKRKTISLKRSVLKHEPWYSAAVNKISIASGAQRSKDRRVGDVETR